MLSATNITCDDNNNICGDAMICSDGEDCNIYCSGIFACDYKTFYCPTDTSACKFTCDGSFSFNDTYQGCYGMSIVGGGGDLTIIANPIIKSNLMSLLSVLCPIDKDCNIICIGNSFGASNTCSDLSVNALNSSSLSVIGYGSSTLAHARILCPDSIGSDINCIIAANS